MGRSQSKVPSNMRRVTIFDSQGNEIQGWVPEEDPYQPVPGKDGEIPEFVNVSGKKQNIQFDREGLEPIEVEPWCMLKGEQFRNMAEKSKAWHKDHAPFRERLRNKKGELDEEYLLAEDQVIADVERMMGITFDYGRMRLRDYRDHGRIVEGSREEREGYPLVVIKTQRDDRPGVINAVADRQQVIDDAEQEVERRGYYK